LTTCHYRGCHPFDRHQATASAYESNYGDASQISTSSELETKQRIVRGNVDFSADIWNTLPSGVLFIAVIPVFFIGGGINKPIALSLVKGLLRYNYTTRSTIAMALQASWIDSDLEDLEIAYQERVSET
jgi:hypothetical protein